MRNNHSKLRVGIVGCGAIGSRIAKSVRYELKKFCQLSGLHDIDLSKARQLEESLKLKNVVKPTLTELIQNCDCMVEAVNAAETQSMIRKALKARKNVLAMSVGKLLNGRDLFGLAKKNRCSLLIPSGAIAGLDAIKAAGLAGFQSITLTTRKPPFGFKDNAYLKEKGIDLSKIRQETVLFEGSVEKAVQYFPQNINVAATLALASQGKNKVRIRIVTSSQYKTNSHEIEAQGPFGRILTQTDNVVCPDNPKTSYLAVLSGIQTLKQFCMGVWIGT